MKGPRTKDSKLRAELLRLQIWNDRQDAKTFAPRSIFQPGQISVATPAMIEALYAASMAARLLDEVIADEAQNKGWGPDVTNLGKLKQAHALLGGGR
jgi:hypothetical protein